MEGTTIRQENRFQMGLRCGMQETSIRFQHVEWNGAGWRAGREGKSEGACVSEMSQIPEIRGHAQGWASTLSSLFCFFFCSEHQHARAWVGWSHLRGPVTGRTIFPTAGDPRPAGIQSLVERVVRAPTPPRLPPPHVGRCLCSSESSQHGAFSLLLKLAHEK